MCYISAESSDRVGSQQDVSKVQELEKMLAAAQEAYTGGKSLNKGSFNIQYFNNSTDKYCGDFEDNQRRT